MAGASSLAGSVQALLGRPVILVQARHHSRVPAEQLLRSWSLSLDEVLTEGADVVDLRLDPGARELLVDRETVLAGAVDAGGVPERGVEHDHRPRRAVNWSRRRR